MPRRNNYNQQPYARYQPSTRACGGKVHHARKYDAEQAAEEAMIIEPTLELRVYRCMDCNGWHLTRARD